EPVLSDTCYSLRPGDTDRYDSFARGLEVQYIHARKSFDARVKRSDPEAPPPLATNIDIGPNDEKVPTRTPLPLAQPSQYDAEAIKKFGCDVVIGETGGRQIICEHGAGPSN